MVGIEGKIERTLFQGDGNLFGRFLRSQSHDLFARHRFNPDGYSE
ncbi:MAG: hypothetical protein ACD_75C01752G0001 [uncultured bacterium]|nr:MAG: hypothetical protein ACD_75C01752G0001 [uncultured bacterium]